MCLTKALNDPSASVREAVVEVLGDIGNTEVADRIELCASLDAEGLTPSPGLMAQAGACGVPTFALIRSRGRWQEPAPNL